ncbi:MAG TPA: hypothetical protein VFO32_01030, partial [Sphingomicrobium sp.]|nr:hypothetical protein [Sphingomicrobium sp.]
MKTAFLAAAALGALSAKPALAQHHDHGQHQPAPPPATEAEEPADHSHHAPAPQADQPADHSQHSEAADDQWAPPVHRVSRSAALGPYPMTREASGTAWQPDTSAHGGLHLMSGDWTLMGHGVLNLVYDHQSGPRGEDKAFASGMLMGMARRPVGDGTLQLRAMLSPDPLMGKRGY